MDQPRKISLNEMLERNKGNVNRFAFKAGLKRQPSTKPRDEEQRDRMLEMEIRIIREKFEKVRHKFRPAEKDSIR